MKAAVRWLAERINIGVDGLCGARITQLTSSAFTSHNIYCEERYTSTDGTRIAFMRFPKGYGQGGHELWVCDLTTNHVALVGPVAYPLCSSSLFNDWLYYSAPPEGAEETYAPSWIGTLDDARADVATAGPERLMRLNLKSLEMEQLFIFDECPPPHSMAVSADGRYFVSILSLGGGTFGLYRVDLESKTWEVFHEQEDICNPHLQFDPRGGYDLMVQKNRGSEVDESGQIVRWTGDEGAVLYVIDAEAGGEPRFLPVGRPRTEWITGHECWIGNTGSILLTVDGPTGNSLLRAIPGEGDFDTIANGTRFNHVSASVDGRFFILDQYGDIGYGRVWVGSFKSGRYLPLCESNTGMGPYCCEPFPYMIPDNRWVIFNSNTTGIGQVYAVAIPEGFLEELAHTA